MRPSLSAADLRAVRMSAQLLGDPQADDVCAVATRLGGVQAQSAADARLAVRARTSGLTAGDVDRPTRREADRRAHVGHAGHAAGAR